MSKSWGREDDQQAGEKVGKECHSSVHQKAGLYEEKVVGRHSEKSPRGNSLFRPEIFFLPTMGQVKYSRCRGVGDGENKLPVSWTGNLKGHGGRQIHSKTINIMYCNDHIRPYEIEYLFILPKCFIL